jgi:hypothetical protein
MIAIIIIKLGNMEIKEIKDHLKNLSIEELRDICSFIEDVIESKKLGNVPIGETFKLFDKEYIVENEQDPIDNCKNCAFDNEPYDHICKHLCCSRKYRNDKQNVIFVKKENNND